MGFDFPRLLGDIGGTNARWGWQTAAGAAPEHISVLPCADHPSPAESIRHYLGIHGLPSPKVACLGVATAVNGDFIQFTNSNWAFSIGELETTLSLDKCLVINDFTALALSLPVLPASDLRSLGGDKPVANSPIGLLGPGTGLGVSGLVPDRRGGWIALSGEGGHVTLSATNPLETSLIEWLGAKFGHVSAERVLSGQGLVNLYQSLCAVSGSAPRNLRPQDITQLALEGSDTQCAQTLECFTSFLGNVAGNIALTIGARAGIYIGGGIVPLLRSGFDSSLFRRKFEEKGRFSQYLAAIPSWLITAQTPALLGAAQALDAFER
jgi:glucokinase